MKQREYIAVDDLKKQYKRVKVSRPICYGFELMTTEWCKKYKFVYRMTYQLQYYTPVFNTKREAKNFADINEISDVYAPFRIKEKK